MYKSSKDMGLRLPESFGGRCTGNMEYLDRHQQQGIQDLRNQLSILGIYAPKVKTNPVYRRFGNLQDLFLKIIEKQFVS